jgi:hypothetical protein
MNSWSAYWFRGIRGETHYINTDQIHSMERKKKGGGGSTCMDGPVKRGGFYRPGVSNFMGAPICYLQAAFAIHWGNGVSLSVLLSTSRNHDVANHLHGWACKKGGFLQTSASVSISIITFLTYIPLPPSLELPHTYPLTHIHAYIPST